MPAGARRLIGWTVVAAVIAALSWPLPAAFRTGVDPSWRAALHLAAADGLRFGEEFVFTYGPLGFLSVPTPFLGPTSALAFGFTAAVHFAVVAVSLWLARQIFPTWAAALVVLLLARCLGFVPAFEALQAFGFLLAVLAISGRLGWSWRGVAVAGGILAAVGVLGKLNVGVFLVGAGAVAAMGVGPRRLAGLAAFVATFVVATGLLWLLAGQSPGDLAAYAARSIEIVGGYSEAMGTDDADRPWVYVAWAAATGLLVWLAFRAGRSWEPARRVALILLVAGLAFAMWKTSFVRGYPAFAFTTALFVTLGLLGPGFGRRTSALTLLATGAIVVAVSTVPPLRYVDGLASVRQVVTQARDALTPWRWDRVADASRARLRRTYALPPAILAELDGRTVHVDPHETAVVAGHPEIAWRPLPVFQSYSAYTTELDRLNGDFLRSAARPERILREFRTRAPGPPDRPIPATVDNRFYWFESPGATLERLCRYEERVASDRWQVLVDTGEACGTERPLARVEAPAGTTVRVPEAGAGELVIVRIRGLEPGLLERIRTSLWKAPEWRVTLDATEYRFVPGTAGEGLVLAVPEAAQGSGPFRFGDPVATLAVAERGASGGRPLVFEFAAVPLPAR